jgi:hypothetical protein
MPRLWQAVLAVDITLFSSHVINEQMVEEGGRPQLCDSTYTARVEYLFQDFFFKLVAE